MLKLPALALSLALLISVSISVTALAAGPYATGTIGSDISWPQCGGAYPSGGSVRIVGVTDGRAFTENSCLASEFSWAQETGSASLYMNLNYAAGSAAGKGASGPYGSCRPGSACYAENFGWNAAQAAFQYARQRGARAAVWWLDIEIANSWSRNTRLNQDIIKGAIDCLLGTTPSGATCSGSASTGITVVGVYSTQSMWRTITGDWVASDSTGTMVIPNWVASGESTSRAAAASCKAPLWSGGTVWLAQYVNVFDWSYAC